MSSSEFGSAPAVLTDARSSSTLGLDEAHAESLLYWNRFAPVYSDGPGQQTVALMDELLDRMPPANLEEGPLLDVACGPGRTTSRVAQRGRPVVGVDLSDAMVALARREHTDPSLQFIQAAAEALPFDRAHFASAVCSLGLMLFPDPRAALEEWARVVRPGGAVGVTVWGRKSHSSLMTITEGVLHSLSLPVPEPPRSPWRLGAREALAAPGQAAGLRLTQGEHHTHAFVFPDGQAVCDATGVSMERPNPRFAQFPREIQQAICLGFREEADRRLQANNGQLTLDVLLGVFLHDGGQDT